MSPTTRARARFLASWAAALALLTAALPHAVHQSWKVVLPILSSVPAHSALALLLVWFAGLWVHSFVLTAAAPSLTRRRALTLNLTGSAVSNLLPMGGAAGMELNRRMMRTWGIDSRAFSGYTFLTNVWDIGSKLLLPLIAVWALVHAGDAVPSQLGGAATAAAAGLVSLVAVVSVTLTSQRAAVLLGTSCDRVAGAVLRLFGREREFHLAEQLLQIRQHSADLVARGWLPMSAGILGYVALQAVLLGLCLAVTGAHLAWPVVLAGFAVERALTIIPITPGGVGVADLGLVGVLLSLGGDPASVAGAAVLFRVFIFAIEIPVGTGTLGLWLLRQRRSSSPSDSTPGAPGPGAPGPGAPGTGAPRPGDSRTGLAGAPGREPQRIAHVTDVFLPRLGGIETHVDDLVRHQRARGTSADVITATQAGASPDPVWVHRLSLRQARAALVDYDLVHVHVSLFSPYGVALARAATRSGLPTLITVHSMWHGSSGLLRLLASTGLGHWPVIWSAVSKPAADVFSRGVGGVDVAVLPNAIDVANWRDPVSRPNRNDRIRLVSVMRLMPRKRPMQLLSVFARVLRDNEGRDLELVIVGDGPLRSRLERRIRRLGLEHRVRVTGRVTRDRVRAELRAADAYVAPATKESFGIAALEARSVGLPVLANARSGVTEFITDRVDGILVDDDAHLARAITELAGDPELLRSIQDHNQKLPPPFDWTDALVRTEELYAQAMNCLTPDLALETTAPKVTDHNQEPPAVQDTGLVPA